MDTSTSSEKTSSQNSSIVYNHDLYIPPSDGEEEGNADYYVMDTIQDPLPSTQNVNEQDCENNNFNQDNLEIYGDDTDTGLYANIHLTSTPVCSPRSNIPVLETPPREICPNVLVPQTPLRTLTNVPRAQPHPQRTPSNLPVPQTPPPPRPATLFDIHNTDSENDTHFQDNSDSDSNGNEYYSNETEPMSNYIRDEENINDFADGWEWENTDTTGPSFGPFTNQPGLRIQPEGQTPLHYVQLFLPDEMLHHIAEQTNLYANRKQHSMYTLLFIN